MPYVMTYSVAPWTQVRVELDDGGKSWGNSSLTSDPRAFPAGYGGSVGVRIDASVLCTSARVISSRKTLPAVFAAHSRYAVSARLRDCIEAIEPGVHQFIPLDVRLKDGSRPADDYFILNICTEVDAIDEAASILRFASGKCWLDGVGARLMLFQHRIAGRAVWYDRRLLYPFVCDAVRDEAVRLKAKVVEFQEVWAH